MEQEEDTSGSVRRLSEDPETPAPPRSASQRSPLRSAEFQSGQRDESPSSSEHSNFSELSEDSHGVIGPRRSALSQRDPATSFKDNRSITSRSVTKEPSIHQPQFGTFNPDVKLRLAQEKMEYPQHEIGSSIRSFATRPPTVPEDVWSYLRDWEKEHFYNFTPSVRAGVLQQAFDTKVRAEEYNRTYPTPSNTISQVSSPRSPTADGNTAVVLGIPRPTNVSVDIWSKFTLTIKKGLSSLHPETQKEFMDFMDNHTVRTALGHTQTSQEDGLRLLARAIHGTSKDVEFRANTPEAPSQDNINRTPFDYPFGGVDWAKAPREAQEHWHGLPPEVKEGIRANEYFEKAQELNEAWKERHPAAAEEQQQEERVDHNISTLSPEEQQERDEQLVQQGGVSPRRSPAGSVVNTSTVESSVAREKTTPTVPSLARSAEEQDFRQDRQEEAEDPALARESTTSPRSSRIQISEVVADELFYKFHKLEDGAIAIGEQLSVIERRMNTYDRAARLHPSEEATSRIVNVYNYYGEQRGGAATTLAQEDQDIQIPPPLLSEQARLTEEELDTIRRNYSYSVPGTLEARLVEEKYFPYARQLAQLVRFTFSDSKGFNFSKAVFDCLEDELTKSIIVEDWAKGLVYKGHMDLVTFYSGEDPRFLDYWFDCIESHLEREGITGGIEIVNFTVKQFRGDALHWWTRELARTTTLQCEEKGEVDNLKHFMRTRFGRDPRNHVDNSAEVRYRTNVSAYVKDFQRHYKEDLLQKDDAWMVEKFIEGLPFHLQIELDRNTPRRLNTAKAMASDFERAYNYGEPNNLFRYKYQRRTGLYVVKKLESLRLKGHAGRQLRYISRTGESVTASLKDVRHYYKELKAKDWSASKERELFNDKANFRC